MAVTLAVFLFLILAADSSARELRPSDHGLVFQSLQPAGPHSLPEMKSFFNSANSSPTMSSNSDVALPRAINSGVASPPSWQRVSNSGDDGGDRVGRALTAASLVCGIAGAALLVGSCLIYLFKYRKGKQNAAFRSGVENEKNNNNDQCESENDDNSKLQLVVLNP